MSEIQNELFRSALAAKYLTLSKQTLDWWRCQGRGPKYLKVGRAVCYRRTDLDEWLSRQVRQSTHTDKATSQEAGEQLTT